MTSCAVNERETAVAFLLGTKNGETIGPVPKHEIVKALLRLEGTSRGVQ